jgi:hypothetical protein
MIGQTKERWMELCERASVEQDSKKLLELTREIERLLAEKEERLRQKPTQSAGRLYPHSLCEDQQKPTDAQPS